jgi:hypothetical protein
VNAFNEDFLVGIKVFTGTPPNRFKRRADIQNLAGVVIPQPYYLFKVLGDLLEIPGLTVGVTFFVVDAALIMVIIIIR